LASTAAVDVSRDFLLTVLSGRFPMITSIPMKPLFVLIIVSLTLLVGCAKNSEVAALKAEIANLQESISAAKNGTQEKADSLQTKCDELKEELANLKAANAKLAADFQSQVDLFLSVRKEVSSQDIQLVAGFFPEW
jgi:TolA-binding protein